ASAGQQTPTVRELREWIDRPQPRGLPEEVENLLVLVYALQANRSFFRHGTAHEASPARLPGEPELRAEPPPAAEEGDAAAPRADAVCPPARAGPHRDLGRGDGQEPLLGGRRTDRPQGRALVTVGLARPDRRRTPSAGPASLAKSSRGVACRRARERLRPGAA